jgi:hypothetical protein
MENLKTTLHVYRFDTREPAGRAAWLALSDKLAARDGATRCFESHGKGSHYLTLPGGAQSIPVELERKHLFGNQWNTAPIPGFSDKGYRVFDWALDALFDHRRGWLKQGHYVELTPAMIEARKLTAACGYCGHQEPVSDAKWCPQCLGSQYLEEKDLPLTRLRPVIENRPFAERHALTADEAAERVPAYRHAQLHGATARDKARHSQALARIHSEYTEDLEKAERAKLAAVRKRDARLWLHARFPQLLENHIYYTHTGRHCLGWRKKLDAATVSAVLDQISEFPDAYTLECEDGRELEGGTP